jgi:hypothetical protein
MIALLRRTIQFAFSLSGYGLVKLNSKSTVANFFSRITTPFDNGYKLVRIGSSGDGGYLLPMDLNNQMVCLSPGVSNQVDFENDLYRRYQIKSILFDGSVDSPKNLNVASTFNKKFIGPATRNDVLSLNDIINGINEEIILQMDIEGDEYQSLIALSDSSI